MATRTVDTIETTVSEIALRAASTVGVRVYDVVFVQKGPRWVLTVFIDREGGVALADCQAVSEQLGAELEAADCIPQAYTLEVSSPGMDRVLRRPEHWRTAEGQRVRFALAEALEGRRRFRGRVVEAGEDSVTVDVDEMGRRTFRIPDLASARIEPEF